MGFALISFQQNTDSLCFTKGWGGGGSLGVAGLVCHHIALKVLLELAGNVHSLLNVGHADGDTLGESQGLGQSDGAADLPAVELVLAQLLGVKAGDASRREEVLKHLGPALLVQGLVVKGHADPAVEGLIKGPDTVGGEEEHSLVVLEKAQEDADHRVPLDVALGAPLQEDISLINEQHRIPLPGKLQDLAQLGLEIPGVDSQLTHSHAVEGPLEQVSNGLAGDGLAGSRRAVEEEDTASTLASDDVGEALGGVLDEGLDKLLAVLVHDQLVKGLVVELDVGKVLDVHLAPPLDGEGEAGNGGHTGEDVLVGNVLHLVGVGLLIPIVGGSRG